MKKPEKISIPRPVELLFIYPTAIGLSLFAGFQIFGVLGTLGGEYGPDAYYVWSSVITSLLPFIFFAVFALLTHPAQPWRQRIFKGLLMIVPAGLFWIAASTFSSVLYPIAIDYGSYADLYVQGGTAVAVLAAFAAILWRLRQKGQW